MEPLRCFLPVLIGLIATAAGAQVPGAPSTRAPGKAVLRASAISSPPPSPGSFAAGGADDCVNASSNGISGPGLYLADTTLATDSPQVGAGCEQTHRDVWFLWTSTHTGQVELSLCGGTSADTVVAVWPGVVCPSGTPLACNDDSCSLQSRVVFPVVNGGAYLLQIGVYGSSTSPGFSGTFSLTVPPPPPANDECAAAIAVAGVGSFPFDNTTATTSAQGQTESTCLIYGSTAMERDVWFTWTAPSSGVATFATCGLTGVDTKIAVYPGAGCPAPGSALACSDDACSSWQSTVQFAVTVGSQFTLEIGVYPGSGGGSGNFSLAIPPPPPPPVPADLNVDVGAPGSAAGSPTSAYGGAAGRPGSWNTRSSTVASSQLDGLTGTASGVVLTRTVATPHDVVFTNPGPAGDVAALMNDAQDVGGVGGTTTWTFGNLYGGNYAVYTYAWAPDDASYRSVVSVPGSTDPPQSVGGAWPGAQVKGVTYALHRVDNVALGGSLAVTVATGTGFGTLNGFQLVEQRVPFTAFCFGDGTGTACPCGNAGTAGNGCANSVNATGARLVATGVASVTSDSLRLDGGGMPNSSCLYFQGTVQSGVAFGDGLRCASGTVIRIGTKANTGSGSRYPEAGDVPISIRGLIPAAGGVREYQCWYRNAAAYCTSATFNLTNGVEVTWQT